MLVCPSPTPIMKLTPAFLLSFLNFAQCSPALAPVELDARQSFGNCYVSGRGDLNVHLLLNPSSHYL
jgi:hypothetical protein